MRDGFSREILYMRRKRHALIVAFFILICVLGIYFLTQIEPVQKKYIYPYPYQELVKIYSEANGIDSALVASVIMNESKFKENARSHRGAIGLMQIMPDTAKWIAGEIGDKGFSIDNLHDPETNIRYGVWYLAELEREFGGNEILSLAAYNAGRGTVWEWIDEYGWPMTFHTLSDIPYPETQKYVENVLKNRVKYEQLYEKNVHK